MRGLHDMRNRRFPAVGASTIARQAVPNLSRLLDRFFRNVNDLRMHLSGHFVLLANALARSALIRLEGSSLQERHNDLADSMTIMFDTLGRQYNLTRA
jgi:hypothetical protein